MDFRQDVADEICERIANGESLRAICTKDREAGWLPGQTTVFKWLGENEDFAKQYARAREAQAEHYADEIVSIADGKADERAEVNEAGEMVIRDHNRDRLRIDARKWVASKLLPKKYGDKIAHVGGNPEDPPIAAAVTVEFVKAKG